jgi:IS5 family transposase
MQKQAGQMGFSDSFIIERLSFLSDVDKLIDWRPFEKELSDIYNASVGRPSYPALTLFKTLLLQQWYGLSDPGMEEALSDRISFRRFAGLSLQDEVPDHSTISRFRSHLKTRYDALMSLLNSQLESAGFVIKKGTMLDASFVSAASAKKSVDPEAGQYGRGGKDKERVSGYKMHAGVDSGSGLVRRVIITPANINDTTPADDLIEGDEKAVYADKAYDKNERRKGLEKRGVFAGIMHRPGPGRPLTEEQTAFNKRISKLRAPVERVFAVLKLHYRMRRTRYLGIARTAVQITLACMAMNIKRALVLAKA